MPSKNRIKIYLPGAYYHIYNRGVAKQEIFSLGQDYDFFLEKMGLCQRDYVNIIAYCLMQNHFHILVQNKIGRGIERFMRSLGTTYSLKYNKKYGRVGHLFQESYKARMIKNDTDLNSTIRYINENPYEDNPCEKSIYPYSSEKRYLFGKDNPLTKL